MSLVIASGYFDPLHVGHIEYLKMAANLGDLLHVIVNNDKQCVLKKGRSFMTQNDRLCIIKSLKFVDYASISIDEDGSVCKSIEEIVGYWQKSVEVFAKGGDRFASEIPERDVCKKFGIRLVDGLGGKIRSSSDLIRSAKKEVYDASSNQRKTN